jgi:chitin synthase
LSSSLVSRVVSAGDELRRTLLGIANNLPRLAKLGVHWSEICICVLLDGRESASRSMVDYLQVRSFFCVELHVCQIMVYIIFLRVQHDLKIYDPTILRRVHKGRPVVVHVFERSVELPKFKSRREYHYPLQLMLAVKERNGGKLNSHLWFFSGFCVQLNPKYTLLVDVGTIPHKDAIVNLYHTMEEDPQLGGACGEIVVRKARPWSLLDASQSFEYKMSHIMDKAAESMFGYITVLPGAFSIYRWVAIRGEPLCAYFTIEEIPITDLGPAVSNMYLAEDRCVGLLC